MSEINMSGMVKTQNRRPSSIPKGCNFDNIGKWIAEFLGTFYLLSTIRVSNVHDLGRGPQFILVVIVYTFGWISGAQFNPSVSITLLISGVGPYEHLKDMRIDVVNDLPGVGENLHDHPIMPMNWGFKNNDMSFSKYQRIDKAIIVGLQYIFFKKGVTSAPFWSTNLFHSIREKEMPELQIFMTPMCFKEEKYTSSFNIDNLLNFGSLFFARGKKAFPGLHFQINLLRPKSTGTVRLKSSNPDEDLQINPNWFSDLSDMDDLVEGMKHTREVLSKPSLSKIVSDELLPGKNVKNDEDMKESIRNHVQTGHHPASTCAMGSDNNKLAVLDEKLRVKGIKNLRVVDASSFPDMISGNINASVIMLAEKAADMILQNIN